MASILERLCHKFARDRAITLEELPDSYYGKANDLNIIFSHNAHVADLFGVEKEGESTVASFYSLIPDQDERKATIEINSSCLTDYLTLLRNTNTSFAQIALERFEQYLESPPSSSYYLELFDDVNVLDLLSVLNSFYPVSHK